MDIDKIKKEVEIDDGHILLGESLTLLKYGRNKDGTVNKKDSKKFVIRQLNWWKEWDQYSYHLAIFLMFYNQVLESSILPDTLDDLEKFRENIKTALKSGSLLDTKAKDKAFKSLCKICKFSFVSVRWMKKNFSIDDWIEIFLYFYLFNTIGKKKGLKGVFAQIGIVQSNYHPVKGKFSSSLKRITPSKRSKD